MWRTTTRTINVLEKISYELKPISEELRLEIDERESKINGTEARIVFKNTSIIKVVTASDSSRGNDNGIMVVYMSKLWSKEELEYLKNNYEFTGNKTIAEKLGRTVYAVTLKANRIGLVKPCKYQNNEYFDNIDSSEKAYWLGFITADGYVVDNKKGGNYELSIELSKTDIEHLYKFKKCIESDAEITVRSKSPFTNIGIDKVYEMCQIRLYSQHIVQSVRKYNVIQNKTYNLVFPNNIDEMFIWDYIRGYFDGDGSLFEEKVTSTSGKLWVYPNVSFVCKCKGYLESLSEILSKNGILSYISHDKTCFYLFIRRQASVRRFFDCIYKNYNCIKLDRKFIRYINLFQDNKLPA